MRIGPIKLDSTSTTTTAAREAPKKSNTTMVGTREVPNPKGTIVRIVIITRNDRISAVSPNETSILALFSIRRKAVSSRSHRTPVRQATANRVTFFWLKNLIVLI